MAIDYTLQVGDAIEPDELVRIVEDELALEHELGSEPAPAHNPTLVCRHTPGFQLSAWRPLGGQGRDVSARYAAEWLGFEPRVSAVFRVSKDADSRAVFLQVLRVTAAALSRLDGDLALIQNGERVRVLRRAGRVLIADDPVVLDAEALSQLRVVYTLGEMPEAP